MKWLNGENKGNDEMKWNEGATKISISQCHDPPCSTAQRNIDIDTFTLCSFEQYFISALLFDK